MATMAAKGSPLMRGDESLARELTLNENDIEKEHLVARSDTESSELDLDTEPTGKRSFTRAAVALFVIATVGFAIANSSRTKYQDESSPTVAQGFVNLAESQYAKIPPWIKRPKPAVCSPAIVINRCLQLSGLEPGAYDGDVNSPKAVVTSQMLADFWMVSNRSVEDYLKAIGAPLTKTMPVTVKCSDLCEKTMASFAPGSVPAVADVGCFFYKSKQPTCSVDVGLNIIMNTHMPRGNRDKMKEQVAGHVHPKLSAFDKGEMKVLDDEETPTSKERTELANIFWPYVPSDQMKLAAARLFRVFPASPRVTLDIDVSGDIKKKRALTEATEVEGCATVGDGYCDAPHSCAPGTDDVDCGVFGGVEVPDDSCTYSHDGQCDEIKYCAVHTDCSDCETCGFGGERLADELDPLTPDDSCSNARDGTCDKDPSQCAKDTDCTDCNTCTYSRHFAPAQWGFMVIETGLKATALLQEALVSLDSGEGSDILKTYIGCDHEETRLELKRVTAEFLRLLDNVNYVYPGKDCKEGMMAYVQSDKPPREGGVYQYFLCKAYMNSGPLNRYLTLLETGFHQKEMLAETAVLDGEAVYGKVLVKKLAAKCAADGPEGHDKGGWCEKSVRNAQSIIFTLGDLARLAQ